MTASHTTRLLAEHWFPRPIAILGAHLVIYNCGRTCVSLGQQLSAGAGEQAPWEAAFQRGTDSAVCDSDVESTRLRQPTMSLSLFGVVAVTATCARLCCPIHSFPRYWVFPVCQPWNSYLWYSQGARQLGFRTLLCVVVLLGAACSHKATWFGVPLKATL